MKAFLKNYRQSPRKVRLVADMIRGKSVEKAQRALLFGEKKSVPALSKLLDSAIANARTAGKTPDDLFVKEIMVDAGIVMRRMEPKARGQGAIIRHRTSRVTLTLGEMAKKVNSGQKTPKNSELSTGQAENSNKKAPAKKTSAAKKSTAKKSAKKAVPTT